MYLRQPRSLSQPARSPRSPAPPAAADPPSPEERSRRRNYENAPPPIVTQQPSRSSEYRPQPSASYPMSSTSHNSRSEAFFQSVSDRELATKLSASLNESTRPTETEDERQARIERERFEQREKLRKERQDDEYWAKYHREREKRREEGQRKNEEQRRSADDWETRFEDGRRRLEQERATRTPEDRHDPTIDVGPADSSGDDDWEAQLAEGRRRLVDLNRTNEANINNNVRSTTLPRRRNSTTGRPDVCSGVDSEEANRARLYAFETQQIARERYENDVMLAAQIAEAEADIRNAEARIVNRRERLVEGMYEAYVYDDLNTGTSHRNDYSLRRDITVADSQQGGATNGMRESGRERALRVIANKESIRHSRRAFSHDPADRIGREQEEAAKQVQGTLALEEPSTRSAVPILANSPSGDSSHHDHVDEVNPLESRIRASNDGVNTDTPTLEEGSKTWSNVKPDGGKQIDEFARKLNEDDDNCSIVSDAAASIFSVASLASSATDLSTASGYSGDQIIAATQHLVHLLSTCEQLRPLYKTAIESNRIGPERFSRNFRRLLKKYSHDLEEEAHDHLDFLAAHLVRNKAKYVARDIVKKFQGSQPRPNPSQESAADEDADPSSDEEESRPMVNSGIAEDIVSASEFLLQSRAFVIFCTEFQKFVAPPLPTEPAPIPVSKTDLVPVEPPTTSRIVLPWKGPSSIFPAFSQVFDTSLERLRIKELPCSPGKQRVRWECKCGKEIFSDFMELRQGGIAQLEKHIEESTGARIIRKNSIQGNPNNSGAYGMVRAWIQNFLMRITGHKGRKPSQGLPQHNTQPACTSQSNRNPSPQGVKILNLMSCMRGSRNGKVLHQDGLEKVDCDKALFLFMRERIKERRGNLKSKLSLRAIRGIEFVKFFLYMGENVDVRHHERYCNDGSCACLPPEDRAKSTQPGTDPEYKCTPIPPGTSPPFSSTFLLHCFESPDCVSEQSSVILDQFPKRTCGRMCGDNHRKTEGWGIYYQEGRDTDKIDLISVVVIIIGSLLFGVLWSVLRMDIQGAFGVSAWWIGVWQVSLSILGHRADRL